jgi:hypothetical protein
MGVSNNTTAIWIDLLEDYQKCLPSNKKLGLALSNNTGRDTRYRINQKPALVALTNFVGFSGYRCRRSRILIRGRPSLPLLPSDARAIARGFRRAIVRDPGDSIFVYGGADEPCPRCGASL